MAKSDRKCVSTKKTRQSAKGAKEMATMNRANKPGVARRMRRRIASGKSV